MINISDLNNKLCAVCYTYGDGGSLFLHCVGHGNVERDDFYIDREEDPFFISPDWDIEIKTIPEDKKQKLRDADYLIVIRVISLDELDKSKMDLILFNAESQHLIEGQCQYVEQTLQLTHDESSIPFIIYRDWYPRIKKHDGGNKYSLWLSVGDLPHDANMDEFKETGVNLTSRE